MILIINSREDNSTDEICKWLIHYQKKFVRINENNLINSIYFDLNRNEYRIQMKEINSIDLSSIKSIFYRNGDFNYELNVRNKISQFHEDFHNDEWSVLNDFLKILLNNYSIKIIGNLFVKKLNKLEVLAMAKEVKLIVPRTYIISTKKDFLKLLNSKRETQWITKSINEIKPLFEKDNLFLNYTREINKNEKLSETFMPSLIQENIDKKYEIRTFFIEKKFWSIAIFSQEHEDSKNDSRISPFNHSTAFKLPMNIENKVYRLAKKLGLKSGSIDWIYSKSNKFYFLEINPSGVFSNVSLCGNYNIEKEIAEML